MIFKNAFAFGRWFHYALTVTVPWCYVITQQWRFRVHFIHAEDFSLSTNSNFMHIAPWSNSASAFSVPILTFSSVSVVFSVVFLRVYLFLCVTAPNHSKQTSYIILQKDVNVIWKQFIPFQHHPEYGSIETVNFKCGHIIIYW